MEYEFTQAKIERHVEMIGVDVRPPIEISLDEHRCQRFSKWARGKFPQLFDRVVLGNQRFEMLKTLEYPGKPAADVRTFLMTPKGPLLAVPRRLSEIDLEPEFPPINDTFILCMRQFLQEFPGRKVLRVGKVNEYIFGCDDINSVRLVAERFTSLKVPQNGEIDVRVNFPDESYNHIFTIKPVTARMIEAGKMGEPFAFGVEVKVDVNNRNTDKEMAKEEWMTVLHAADMYSQNDVYNVLNGEEGSST